MIIISELYFCRHAQSQANIGIKSVDSPLSQEGIEQAKELTGSFDCVIVSPLRRALETLHYSQIKYDVLIINENFRERIMGESERKIFEDKNLTETDSEFWSRTTKFETELKRLCSIYKKILLIGHAYFYNGWYRKGCFYGPSNAEIIQMDSTRFQQE